MNERRKLIEHFKKFNTLCFSKEKDLLDLISTKNGKEVFPPYIPLIGSKYFEKKILIYATAQNISQKGDVYKKYNQSPDLLIERLYYSTQDEIWGRYNSNLNYTKVDIEPWNKGILPALAGLFIRAIDSKGIVDFQKIQQYVAVSNYFKFSLHTNTRDKNPNTFHKDLYHSESDKLVKEEISVLEPTYVLIFGKRQEKVINDFKFPFMRRCIRINDPAWILKGAGGCLTEKGSWYKEVNKEENKRKLDEITDLVENYKKQIRECNKNECNQDKKYGTKLKAIEIYLKKYYLDWNKKNK